MAQASWFCNCALFVGRCTQQVLRASASDTPLPPQGPKQLDRGAIIQEPVPHCHGRPRRQQRTGGWNRCYPMFFQLGCLRSRPSKACGNLLWRHCAQTSDSSCPGRASVAQVHYALSVFTLFAVEWPFGSSCASVPATSQQYPSNAQAPNEAVARLSTGEM